MNQTALRATIQSSVDRLVREISEAFAQAFADVATSVGGAKPTRRAAQPARRAPVAKAALPSKPGKRIRRSEAQLASDGERIVKLLAANRGGLRIEQINEQLGMRAGQLARPIMKLLAEGRIKKAGQKRATTYLPAAAPAPGAKPAPRKVAQAKARRGRTPKVTAPVASEQILALLASSKEGLRAEQINKALRTTSAAIKEPLKKLLDQGEIKRTGKARGTVYSKA